MRIELRAALFKASQTGQPVETAVPGLGDADPAGRPNFRMRVVPVREGTVAAMIKFSGVDRSQAARVYDDLINTFTLNGTVDEET